jgi:hypothetical protein
MDPLYRRKRLCCEGKCRKDLFKKREKFTLIRRLKSVRFALSKLAAIRFCSQKAKYDRAPSIISETFDGTIFTN